MNRLKRRVAPFTGAWIEICDEMTAADMIRTVAPFTGAWIEIHEAYLKMQDTLKVAPFTGAWIEIRLMTIRLSWPGKSHPSRVRGLK